MKTISLFILSSLLFIVPTSSFKPSVRPVKQEKKVVIAYYSANSFEEVKRIQDSILKVERERHAKLQLKVYQKLKETTENYYGSKLEKDIHRLASH